MIADRQARIAASLDSVHEALRFVHRELEGAATDPQRWRWISVGAVIALQGALVAALSGYETAEMDDVVDPSYPERYAPVTLLLRRARSTDYLNPPERLVLTGAAARRIEQVIAFRNGVVHGTSPDIHGYSESIHGPFRETFSAIQHVLLVHPAFEPGPHGLVTALIADQVAAITRRLLADG
jgi:hypothetical protein